MATGSSRNKRKRYSNLEEIEDIFIDPRKSNTRPGYPGNTNYVDPNTTSVNTTSGPENIPIKSDTTTGRKKIFVSKTPSRVKRGLRPKGRHYNLTKDKIFRKENK